jgi:hypothetical protein
MQDYGADVGCYILGIKITIVKYSEIMFVKQSVQRTEISIG